LGKHERQRVNYRKEEERELRERERRSKYPSLESARIYSRRRRRRRRRDAVLEKKEKEI